MHWDNVRHYHPSAFACPCCGAGADLMWPDLIGDLEALCTRIDDRLVVMSGYRCPGYHRRIGGARDSLHHRGGAVDVICHGAGERAEVVRHALDLGLTVGVGRRHLHLEGTRGDGAPGLYPIHRSRVLPIPAEAPWLRGREERFWNISAGGTSMNMLSPRVRLGGKP